MFGTVVKKNHDPSENEFSSDLMEYLFVAIGTEWMFTKTGVVYTWISVDAVCTHNGRNMSAVAELIDSAVNVISLTTIVNNVYYAI